MTVTMPVRAQLQYLNLRSSHSSEPLFKIAPVFTNMSFLINIAFENNVQMLNL